MTPEDGRQPIAEPGAAPLGAPGAAADLAASEAAAARAHAAARRLSRAEFVAICAVLAGTVAFSIDAMLPALPEIAAALAPADPNRAQLVLTSFVLGMGVGTFFAGPLSDAFGRRPVIFAFAGLFVLGAALSWAAPSLELLLAGRLIQGLGAAGPRVVTLALVRDLYQGRAMAKIMSFVMMVFTLLPAIAPTIGAVIIALFGWRAVFGAFVLFSLVSVGWLALRQPETLPRAARRPLSARRIGGAVREVFSHRNVVLSIAVQTLIFGAFFGVLSSVQPVFDQTFGRAESFPLWFGAIAVVSGSGALANALLVERLGMRAILRAALAVQALAASAIALVVWTGALAGAPYFAAYLLWTVSVFTAMGLTMGNLNAIAMEPLGHIAGLAASVIGAVSTVLAMLIAIPVGLAFDGTPLPAALSVAACCGVGLLLAAGLAERRHGADNAELG